MLRASQQGRASGERMTAAAWTALNKALVAGEVATYAQARKLLAEHGVSYKDDSSVLKLFKRHQIKAKTGRPRHEKTELSRLKASASEMLTYGFTPLSNR